MYQKNRHLVDALILGRAPDFVSKRNPPRKLEDIPVFTFHVAVPERFEKQCAHLAENGYHTLSADEFRKAMSGEIKPKKNSVLITFDDGLKQVWSVAFPLLRKYGLKATVFLVPGCIEDTDDTSRRPTLDDVWSGSADVRDVFGVSSGESALATWPEIKEMHSSGVVDFHSHTMWHTLVFSSSNIVDFGRPDFNTHYFGNVHVPMYQREGKDATSRELLLGMPIYEAAPRMQVEHRYFDDERLRDYCIEFVSGEGDVAFFESAGWRKRLSNLVAEYRSQHEVCDRIETSDERDAAVVAELSAAKDAIESQLHGHTVDHLCYPWYRGRKFAQDCATKTGHLITYFDREPGVEENIPGSGQGKIARIDETWLRRLPGSGRVTKRDIIRELFELRNVMSRMFPDNK